MIISDSTCVTHAMARKYYGSKIIGELLHRRYLFVGHLKGAAVGNGLVGSTHMQTLLSSFRRFARAQLMFYFSFGQSFLWVLFKLFHFLFYC